MDKTTGKNLHNQFEVILVLIIEVLNSFKK